MRINSLILENFRNYPSLELEFGSAPKHVLIGPNGAGKTNVLESLSLLAYSRSPLCKEDDAHPHWGEEYYRISAHVCSKEGDCKELSVAFQQAPRRKKISAINGVPTKTANYIGELPMILFLPQDLDLFTGSPSRRRAFLDTLLCQVSPEYLQAFSQYQQVLKQRNRLLKSIRDGQAHKSDLAPWNEALSQSGAVLTSERLSLIEVYQCTLEEELRSRGESWSSPRLKYLRKTVSQDPSELSNELEDALTEHADRDVILQATTVGPHREDWVLEVEGRPIASFASRGQQRTVLLCLLALQISYLELKRGEKPVVLLDDVFSELDENHQELLMSSLGDVQVFLSTTHLPARIPDDVCIWEVSSGVVRAREGTAVQ